MTTANYYVIDTSSLIELNRRYPIDVFPSLWKNVEGLIAKNLLISHKEVLKEICQMYDALKKWAQKQKKLFREITPKQIEIVEDILKKYPSLAKSDNESAAADPFVIALAVELSGETQKSFFEKTHIIVTEEKLRGTRVRIPLVSKDYDKIKKCINIIEMCRIEGWQF